MTVQGAKQTKLRAWYYDEAMRARAGQAGPGRVSAG